MKITIFYLTNGKQCYGFTIDGNQSEKYHSSAFGCCIDSDYYEQVVKDMHIHGEHVWIGGNHLKFDVIAYHIHSINIANTCQIWRNWFEESFPESVISTVTRFEYKQPLSITLFQAIGDK